MDNNEKIRDRIKKSLINATNIVKLSKDIENEISEILNVITELTNGQISYVIGPNLPVHPQMSSCQHLVRLNKRDSSILRAKTFFGYAINSTTAFPVILETEVDYYECPDIDVVRDTILNIIDQKALNIIRMTGDTEVVPLEDEDIPF